MFFMELGHVLVPKVTPLQNKYRFKLTFHMTSLLSQAYTAVLCKHFCENILFPPHKKFLIRKTISSGHDMEKQGIGKMSQYSKF